MHKNEKCKLTGNDEYLGEGNVLAVSVCHSVQVGGRKMESHVTITYNAFDLTVHGPPSPSPQDMGPGDPTPFPSTRHGTGVPIAIDI